MLFRSYPFNCYAYVSQSRWALAEEEMQLEKIEIEKAKNRDDIKDENISITIKGV